MEASKAGSSKAQALWQECLVLEKKLKAVLRKRSFWDPEPRALRSQLLGRYEALLFTDLAFAGANDVEQLLWKGCFYRPLEEFRGRAREADKAGPSGASQMAALSSAALSFLEEAGAWYRRLVVGLQAAYGDCKVALELSPEARAEAARLARSAQGGPQRDVRASIHRCLIYLGDLARYAAQLAQQAAANAARHGTTTTSSSSSSGGKEQGALPRPDWGKAATYYKLAARVLPGSGHPHNQLAVMAFYTGDELRAVTYYCRALAARVPFLTARENLHLLFEQNRARYAQLPAPGSLTATSPIAAAATELGVRFVRLSGLLFDRINLEEFDQVLAGAFASLKVFLQHPHSGAYVMRQPKADAVPMQLLLLALVGLALQSQHGGGGSSGSSHHRPGHGAAASPSSGAVSSAQRAQLRAHALQVLLKYGSVLAATAATCVATSAPEAPHLLAAAHVLLQWLAAHPHYLAAEDAHPHYPAEAADRAALLSGLQKLLEGVAAAAPPPSEREGAAAGRGSDGGGGGALEEGCLPEEVELLGFEPLVDHTRAMQAKQVGKMAVDEPGTRAMRMLAAATTIATHAPQLAVLLPRRGRHQQQQQAPGAVAAAGGLQAPRPSSHHHQHHQQQQQAAQATRPPSVAGMEVDEGPPAGTPAAAAAGGGGAEDMDTEQQQAAGQEEEVILFQPRRSSAGRASRASDGMGPEAAWPTAAAGGGSGAGSMHHMQQAAGKGATQPSAVALAASAAAASAPPPLPAQLISSSLARQAAGSAPNSPGLGAARPALHRVCAPAAGVGGGGGGFVSPTILPPGSQRAASAAGAGGAGLLQGAAATALDLQQAQQASDALLARLQPKGPPAADPLFAAAGAPPASSGLNGTGVGAPGGPSWDVGWGGGTGGADGGWGFSGHVHGGLGGGAAAGGGPSTGGPGGHMGPPPWQGMDLHTRPPSPMAATSAAAPPPPVVPSSSEINLEGGWGGSGGQPLSALGLVNGGGGTWGRDLRALGSPSWALQQPGLAGAPGAASSATAGLGDGTWGTMLPLQQQQQGAAAPISIVAASSAAPAAGAAAGVPPSWEGEPGAGVPLSASYRLELTAKAAAASILSPYKPDGEGDAAAAALVPELLLQQPGGGVPPTSLTAGGPVRSLWALPATVGLDGAAAAVAAAAAAAAMGGGGQQRPGALLRLGPGGWPGASDMWGPAQAAGVGGGAAAAVSEEQPLKFIEYMGWQPGLLEAPTAEGHPLQQQQQQQQGLGQPLPGTDGLRLPLAALHTHTTSNLSSAHTTPRAGTPAGGGQPGTPGWSSGLGPPGSARTSHSGDIPLHPPGSGSRRPSTAGAAPTAAPGAGGLFAGPELFGDVLLRGGGHHRRLSSGGFSGASGEEAPHLRHHQQQQQHQQPWGHPGPSGLRTGSGGLAPGSPASPLRGMAGHAPGAAVSSVLDGMGWAAAGVGGGGASILGSGRDMAAGGLSLGLASLAAAGGGPGAGGVLGLAVSGGGAGPVPGLTLEGSQPGVLLPPTDCSGPANPFLS